jgi:hypothetical protein
VGTAKEEEDPKREKFENELIKVHQDFMCYLKAGDTNRET